MTGDGGYHHGKLGLERISCVSQLTIPDMVGTSSAPVGINTNKTTSKPNQACRTPDFSQATRILHIGPIFVPHFSLSRPQLYDHRNNTKWIHPSLSLHAIIMSSH
jgi:hypothetical protein